MKIIQPTMHGILDYIVVFMLLGTPFVLDFSNEISIYTFNLAFIHFILTIFTDFDMGLIRKIPLAIHGHIELIVSIALTVAALFLPFFSTNEKTFYLFFGALVFATWLLSDYSTAKK